MFEQDWSGPNEVVLERILIDERNKIREGRPRNNYVYLPLATR